MSIEPPLGVAPSAASDRYSFYGRLKASFPSQIIVDTTEVCNLECIHCPHPSFKKSEHYTAAHLPAELNRKVADEVKQHGIGFTEYLRYTGAGEPLVHPDIFEMLDYSARNSGVYVCLTTNGTLLNEKRIEKLLATDIHLVDISLDAITNDVYKQIRVRGNLDVTRANVLNLLKRKAETGSSMRVVVSYVEQPINMHETDRFEAFWKEQGADYVVVRRQHSAAGHHDQMVVELKKRQADTERRPCLYPWERIMVNARGQLSFCPQDWVHGSALEDYRETTIFDTWRGEKYAALRTAHLTGKFCDHSFCENCPDWELTRWPDEGRSYANMVEEFIQRV